jgi:hypothetical protein
MVVQRPEDCPRREGELSHSKLTTCHAFELEAEVNGG